jgi:hypothetical protein
MAQPVEMTRLSGVCRARSGKGNLWVEIITHLRRLERESKLDRERQLISFEDFKSIAPAAVGQWFAVQGELREVVALILASKYVRGYTTTEFLNLTQALEAFHRRVFGGSHYDEYEYKKIYLALVEGMPSGLDREFRDKLTNLYKYANESTFRRRLRDLCEKLDPSTRSWLGEMKSFVGRVVKTRNYLTHLSEDGQEGSFLENAEDLGDLWRANLKLNGLATVHLLKQIGIPEDKVATRAFRFF